MDNLIKFGFIKRRGQAPLIPRERRRQNFDSLGGVVFWSKIATFQVVEMGVGSDWFAGGFLWKWHVNDLKAGGLTNNNYTPQNKPVESIIKNWYSNDK